MPAFTLSPTVRRQARILAGLKLRTGPSPVQSPNRWSCKGGSAPPSSPSSTSTALTIPGQKLPARLDRFSSTSYSGELNLWREGTRLPTSYMTVASPGYSPIY